jgi:hypothetical protein
VKLGLEAREIPGIGVAKDEDLLEEAGRVGVASSMPFNDLPGWRDDPVVGLHVRFVEVPTNVLLLREMARQAGRPYAAIEVQV